MRQLKGTGPDDKHLLLKRDMREKRIDAKILADETGLSYSKIVRALRNEREFTASEIGTIAKYLGIKDISKFFLGGTV